MSPRVYILLPVHNRKATTKRFVHCLLSQSYENWHLVLIDDGCSDGTQAMVRSRVTSLTVLQGQGRWWWGGALEQGYQWLKRKNVPADDLVLTINDDTEFGADFLAQGVAALQPRSLLLAQLYNIHGEFQEAGVQWNWRDLSAKSVSDQARINCFSTRGLLLRVGDFGEIGGFHPILLPHYLSDYEFTLRAHKKGFGLQTEPRFFLRNDESQTGIRSTEGMSAWRTLRANLSMRSSSNPFHWTGFILLGCPARYVPVNLARTWRWYFSPVTNPIRNRLAPLRPFLGKVKRRLRKLLPTD